MVGFVAWAAVTAVEPAPDGIIYVVHRCFENSCAGRKRRRSSSTTANGKLLATWGEGMFIFPHGATVDRDGNLWVTDARGENGKGHQVFKFSPDGKVLMTLGKAGVSGSGPISSISRPTCSSRRTATIFVTDSHRNGKNNRVVKFTKDGKFIKEWGTKGIGPGEISEPHTIAMDSRGRLFVGDRENNRIQIFDQDGKFSPSGGSSAARAASPSRATTRSTSPTPESGPDTGAHELPGIKKGIRIGSARRRRGHGVHRGHGIDGRRSLRRRRRRRRCAGQRLRRGRAAADAGTPCQEIGAIAIVGGLIVSIRVGATSLDVGARGD